MISTMWTLAPGARGPVGLAVRPAACVVEPPVAARLRAVPATPAAQRPGTRAPGFDLVGIDVFGAPAIGAFGTTGDVQQPSKRTTTEHNGTTLGIHSSGRPSS
ncbi:hypothetical protein ACU610_15335 [Geodermatophilus sp. URMC 61]|uniref:hypothetical protein n=1 Tax=Geodermatophilus sp. URMC 61 TaxID=3423411 RepID=UPI00406D0EF5